MPFICCPPCPLVDVAGCNATLALHCPDSRKDLVMPGHVLSFHELPVLIVAMSIYLQTHGLSEMLPVVRFHGFVIVELIQVKSSFESYGI